MPRRLSVFKMIVHESQDEATMLFRLLGVSHLARQIMHGMHGSNDIMFVGLQGRVYLE